MSPKVQQLYLQSRGIDSVDHWQWRRPDSMASAMRAPRVAMWPSYPKDDYESALLRTLAGSRKHFIPDF